LAWPLPNAYSLQTKLQQSSSHFETRQTDYHQATSPLHWICKLFKAFWEYGAHIIMPQLTDLTGLSNKKFQQCWTSCRKCIFEEVKLLITSHILLNYPNPHLPYDIEPDASDYQLGTSNKQAGLPIAFFRRKLNNAQNNYSTIKKE
jgi:hypothetical protein